VKEKRSIVIILSFFIIFFCTGLGIFLYTWLGQKEKQIWQSNLDISMSSARESNQPIILAITSQACGSTDNTICPDPAEIPALQDFTLINVISGTHYFKELEYDDRFARDMEELPQFFLLNPDGEIRDVRSQFPDLKLLQRWKEIK
jgi:hypothetical protein